MRQQLGGQRKCVVIGGHACSQDGSELATRHSHLLIASVPLMRTVKFNSAAAGLVNADVTVSKTTWRARLVSRWPFYWGRLLMECVPPCPRGCAQGAASGAGRGLKVRAERDSMRNGERQPGSGLAVE